MTYYAILRALGAHGDTKEASTWRHAAHIVFAGGFAGMVDWCLSIAPDTLKTRIQTGELVVMLCCC